MALVTVAATATQIVAKNLSRIALFIKNNDTVTVFIGTDNTVTTANGYPLTATNQWVFDFHGNADSHALGIYRGELWGVVAAATADVRVLDLVPPTEF